MAHYKCLFIIIIIIIIYYYLLLFSTLFQMIFKITKLALKYRLFH